MADLNAEGGRQQGHCSAGLQVHERLHVCMVVHECDLKRGALQALSGALQGPMIHTRVHTMLQ